MQDAFFYTKNQSEVEKTFNFKQFVADSNGSKVTTITLQALMTKPNDDGTATICASTAPHLPPDLQS